MKAPAYTRLRSEELEWVKFQSPRVQTAVQRLVRDERMKSIWKNGFDELSDVAYLYARALNRDAWSATPKGERDKWLTHFEHATEEFLNACARGPCTPAELGFPVTGEVMLKLAEAWRVDIRETGGIPSKRHRLRQSANSTGWSVVDAVNLFRQLVRQRCRDQQLLSKPRDPKAARKQFIIELRMHTRLSTKDVATITEVVFQDENVDDRLVRRHVSGTKSQRSRKSALTAT